MSGRAGAVAPTATARDCLDQRWRGRSIFQWASFAAQRLPLWSGDLDASVLVAALVDAGAQGEWAERIIAAGSLHAPELALVEITA